ncbi:GTP-dependent dephospho-CoA kinase family protein [Halorussus salilacus]|uniref:GTP-dependent dephospho-CoA kinase family protein n=1 Tax=Halorussus salilacus TaxID=2953750 RepID=UPI0020A1F274|nr:GTP-dependent dephospho-CoA kinase family protein [Halorussus salilacus]USZ67167.1 GTP-dependent dephospho-CoA kinase family protein [Halorussus salilacus]
MSDVLVSLPLELRGELKQPLGPVLTDAERLLSDVDGPLVAVGDVVTYHLERAGVTPDVAVVDGLTKREAVDDDVAEGVARAGERAREVRVENPAGTLTREMVAALRDALADPEPTVIVVEGEEDLVALPALLAAPVGASVVYGQPDEGMVHATVTDDRKEAMRDLLGRMDGDPEELFKVLEST